MTEPVLQWIKQEPVFNTTGNDVNVSSTVDGSGNVYVAYRTDGTISGGTLSGLTDIVVFKLDTNGVHQWSKQETVFNTTGNNFSPSIAVDGSGNVYIAYTTNGTVSGGTLSGPNDIVVFKLDTNGNHQWNRQQSTFNTSLSDNQPSIAVHNNGNIYVAYQTNGTISGGTLSGTNDIVVFKLDTDGNHQWSKQQSTFNTNGTNGVPSISVDSNENIYVSYETNGTISGGTFSGISDLVVFKLDKDGNHQWSKQQSIFNTSNLDGLSSIAVDGNDNVYIAYQTNGTVSGGTTSGATDIVVFKLDTNGTHQWSKQETIFNTIGSESFPSIALDQNGNVYVAYHTNGIVSGGTFAGVSDIVVFKLDTNGVHQWSKQQTVFNTTLNDNLASIGIDDDGNIYVAYATTGTVSGGTFSGIRDIAVFKLAKQLKQDTTFKSLADCFATYLGNLDPTTPYMDVLSVLIGFCDLLKQRIEIERKLNKANLTNASCDFFNKSTYQQSLCKKVNYESLLASLSMVKTILECDVSNYVNLNSPAISILTNLFGPSGEWLNPTMSCFDDLTLYYNNKACGSTGIVWEPIITECMEDAILLVC
ncbi:NHl repeat unit of beta-propeller protein [Fadolivirus algeromassiliense]|jgi:hypothetical protein|uniref:NHl repeat unit of beta-propeller protein n=1 Tax=Fadolivirus FV1/VV64 TaxID=3070911 RepID=A0A7D3UU09_9VIRU|nr:NHl repeat unit of beta-propeller protein [Fadolivirus algeromassiliense]QKF94770.1 NHl repeat unit of beta-propeller protein [Fadolivirus FV1/VV64]